MAGIWASTSGPLEYHDREGADISVGWRWTLERDGREHLISVEHVRTTGRLSQESIQAMRTCGWSAVKPHLGEDNPPRRIVINTDRLSPEYEVYD